MEVDEIQRQASKFQKISCNGSSSISDNSTNPNKLKGNLDIRNQKHQFPVADGGGGVGRLFGWPSSRIVRVSRTSGGKDRHSKVLTSKGLRDRRVRLSVTTAIQFYDLQDRLGYDQPSKAVEWLIKAASSSIAELPSLGPSFAGADSCNLVHNHHHNDKKSTGDDAEFEDPNYQNNNQNNNTNNNDVSLSKSSACSSTSETSRGSGLSLSRSENRIRARERARDMAAKKEKEKESAVVNNSSFTDLLTGGISSTTVMSPNNNSNPTESRIHWTTTPMAMDYSQMPQFNIEAGDNHPPHHQHFSFLQENFAPVVTTVGGGGESYNLNFSIASSSSGGGLPPGYNRGTLQSNLVSILPHHQHHFQRFQSSSSMVDGSTSTNFPFFISPTIGSGAPDHFPYESHVLQLYGGGDGGRHSDHHKGKSKN